MKVPHHIGIIPDGNRRWAKKNNMDKHCGYNEGLAPGLKLFELCKGSKIDELTFYGFTTDNLKRPSIQVEAFKQACCKAVKLISKDGASLLVLGNYDSPHFPEELKKYSTRQDINGGGIKLNFLVNYGWEWDFENLSPNSQNRGKILSGLKSNDVSRIDLVIRWGGMRRLSGFLPLQTVYSDFYVCDNMWPDFCEQDFKDALEWYKNQDDTLGG